jgi:hypothetical protein
MYFSKSLLLAFAAAAIAAPIAPTASDVSFGDIWGYEETD